MKIDRRTLLAGIGGGTAVALLGTGATAQAATRVERVGLQMFTVRDIFPKDPVGTLEKIARIGYREIEYGGGSYETMDHAMLRRTMDRLKLTAPSIHVPYAILLNQFGDAVKMARALGTKTIVMPWLPEEQRSEVEFEAVLSNLNRFASQLRSEGISLAYHNHDFEFTRHSRGVSLFDRLMVATDPQLVGFELDLYWAVRAGEDIPALIERLAPRLYSFHVKDLKRDGSMAAVGTGTIDFSAIFRLPGARQVRRYIVENDQAPAPYFPDMATSFRNLRALRF